MRRALILAAAAIALAVGVAGCGSDDSAGTPSTITAAGGETALTLIVWPKGPDEPGATHRTLTVTCPADPADPDCIALLALPPETFDSAPPPGQACTQIYGGPQTLDVEGVIAGRPVKTTFSRTDGCQITRWDLAAPLLKRMGKP